MATPKGGYAGHGSGVNNPDNQFVQGANAGPPPVGRYRIGKMQDYTIRSGPHKGGHLQNAMTLTPEPGTNVGPRNGLLIHGANQYVTPTASEGCEVLPPSTRFQIAGSGINEEQVDR
ncbi:MAG: tlde1 domain-containing protein [Acidobacteriaceae bacterium]